MKAKDNKKFDVGIESQTKKNIPNKTTLAAHQEALAGNGIPYNSMKDFWVDMGVKFKPKSYKEKGHRMA